MNILDKLLINDRKDLNLDYEDQMKIVFSFFKKTKTFDKHLSFLTIKTFTEISVQYKAIIKYGSFELFESTNFDSNNLMYYFYYVIYMRDLKSIIYFINKYKIDDTFQNVFICSCFNKNINKIELIETFFSKEEVDEKKEDFFMLACTNNQLDVMIYLSDINISDINKIILFEHSISKGNLEIFKWLYDNNDNFDIYITLFSTACIFKNLDIAKFIYSKAIETNSFNKIDFTKAFNDACEYEDIDINFELIKWIYNLKKIHDFKIMEDYNLCIYTYPFKVLKWICINEKYSKNILLELYNISIDKKITFSKWILKNINKF